MRINQNIVTECINGDRRSQFVLYKMLYEHCFGLCMRYRKDKNEATISFNEGFVKIIKSLATLQNPERILPWAKRILVNHIMNQFRSENARKNHESSMSDDIVIKSSIENEGSSQMNADYLRRLLTQLPSTTRVVFNLFAIEGYSHKEIGEKMGMSEGTSKWHVSDARKKLRAALDISKEHQLQHSR